MKIRILFLSTLLALACTACTQPQTSAASAEPQSASVSPSEKSSDSTVAAEATETPETVAPAEETATYPIGETFQVNDFEITVDSFEFVEQIETTYHTVFTPDEGNVYAVVSLTVTNNGTEADTFLPSFGFGTDTRARILFGDGYEFSPITLLGYENDMHDSALNPLSTKSGQVVFDISKTVSDSTEPLTLRIDGANSIEVQLR